MDDITADTFFNGRIRVNQQREGYRFSIDAVLLAHFTGNGAGGKVLDLGTGCGIIPMIIGYLNSESRIWGIEIQSDLAGIAECNVAENELAHRITILRQDIKGLKRSMTGGPVDLVVTNPPYRKLHSGRMNPNAQRAIARHEVKAALADFIKTANRMLDISGRFVIIYPVERLTELLCEMKQSGIEPKHLRMVHSYARGEAKLALVEGKKGGRPGMKAGAPMVIYQADGRYTPEVAAMFDPRDPE